MIQKEMTNKRRRWFWKRTNRSGRTSRVGTYFDMAKKIQQLKKLDVQKIPDRIPLPTAVVSWYTVLSDITQDLVSHHKLHSLMYINRRYPYIYAGTRRKKISHIVVYVDQSSSVSGTTLNIRNALIELSYSFDFVTYPFTHIMTVTKRP